MSYQQQQDVCAEILERVTGIKPHRNGMGNPRVTLVGGYDLAMCPWNIRENTPDGEDFCVEHPGGSPSGHAMANTVKGAETSCREQIRRAADQAQDIADGLFALAEA